MEANTNLPGIGDRLANRYRIMFGRGAGPSGAVFKALDLENDLSVALKVLNAAFFEGPFAAMNIARLSRAAEIEDPNVVKVYDFVSSEGRHFVTSQLVEGLSLRAVLDLHDEGGEHFPVPKLKSFGERMLNGVRAFHRKGLVHGNIKPENFFVLPDRLALSDPWHLVERTLRDGEHIPVSDYYRGPEQLTDPTIEIPQSDLYAVGLILGELIAISPVKPGLALSTQVPRLTKRFDELFVTATALDPNARFDSVDSFATCMREAFSNVQKEGLWVRRMHETGSFRAIRVPTGAGPEVEPLAEMPVESLLPEKKVLHHERGDLMDISEPEFEYAETPDDDYQDGEYAGASAAVPEVPEPEPSIPEADDEGVVTFESVTKREQPAPIADMQKVKGGNRGKKAVRTAMPPPEPPKPAPAPQNRSVTQPQRPVQPPQPSRTSQSFRTTPPPVPPSGSSKKKPFGLIFLVIIIVALLAIIAYIMAGQRQKDNVAPTAAVTTNQPATIAAVQAPAPAPAQAPAPAPAPVPAPEPAPVAPVAEPAAAPAPAPEPPPPPPPPPAPEPPKAQKLADMLMCAGSNQVLIVTDPGALNGSGKKPTDVAFCIDKQEYMDDGKPVGGMNLTRAKSLCKKSGKTVCSARQWQDACTNGKAGLQNMVGGFWEWALDGRLHGGDSSSEGPSCNSSDKRFSPKSTDGTRCCGTPEYKL